jgi:hypothetical protein
MFEGGYSVDIVNVSVDVIQSPADFFVVDHGILKPKNLWLFEAVPRFFSQPRETWREG